MGWVFAVVVVLGRDREKKSELTGFFDGNNFDETVLFFLGNDFGALGEGADVITDSPRGVGGRNTSTFDGRKLGDNPLFEGREGVTPNNSQLHNRGRVIFLIKFK